MEDMTRQAIEQRALELWQAAGAPNGGGLRYWLLAERQLGVLPKVDRHDPFVLLSRLAASARDAPGRDRGRQAARRRAH